MHLLDIDQLRTFVAISDTGSFTKAADIVHKTQSAVSMQMKRLEERLGRPVFERDGRASRLSEDGERLLDYARRIVRLNSECVASFNEADLTGRVRLGLPDDYAECYLPEILARFSRAPRSPSPASRRRTSSSASRTATSTSPSSPMSSAAARPTSCASSSCCG
jgi:DNA-binding transcriptional LysR family regulator